jgi:hypothetical protein
VQKIDCQKGIDLPGYRIFFAIVGLSLGKVAHSSLLIIKGCSSSHHKKARRCFNGGLDRKILNIDKRVSA